MKWFSIGALTESSYDKNTLGSPKPFHHIEVAIDKEKQPNLKPLPSAGRGWIASSDLEMNYCPKWKGSSIFGSLSMHGGRTEQEIDKWTTDAVPVCCEEEAAELSIYKLIYIPALTCGHEIWLLTERMRH